MKQLFVMLLVFLSANVRAEVFEYPMAGGSLRVVVEPVDKAWFKKEYGEWSVNTMGWEGGKPPATRITSITFKIAKQEYQLESDHMFNPGLKQDRYNLAAECMGGYCIVRGVLGNGTAAYAVQWVMRDGKSRRSVLSSDPYLRHLLYKYIRKNYK